MKQQERPTIEFRSFREKPRRKRKALKIGLISLLVLGLLAGGIGLYLWDYINDKFKETQEDIAVDPLPPGQAYNIMVLGSDRRDVVDRAQQDDRQFRGGSGNRADTIFVIHVPADQGSATILSFPRDLRVKIPGKSGYSKINAAYNGGPDLMIKTIKSLTGLKIHHYVEINFASFQSIVDAVGGVRLCVDRAYDDKESGLIIKKPGCQIFDGKLALSYVRMRKQDPTGDFGRIERQQQFIRVLMGKVKSVGFLTDFPAVKRLADEAAKGITTDKQLSLAKVKDVGNKLADFKESKVDFRVVPSYPDYIGGVSYVIQKDKEAKALYTALRNDTVLPPYGKTGASIPKPEDVTVTVLNGTGTSGLAGKVRDELEALGFDVRDVGNADRRDFAKTTIFYKFGAQTKAALLNDEFPGADVKEGSAKQDTDILIVLGADQVPSASPSPS